MAERVGFEPTVPCGTPHFECGTFDRTLPPLREALIHLLNELNIRNLAISYLLYLKCAPAISKLKILRNQLPSVAIE